jgi:hypothetical protein
MKQKAAGLFLFSIMICAFMTGCKVNIPCQNCENFATLQGTIMDAVTGERIGGTTSGRNQDMEIYLIQGATIRQPTSFIGDANNSLVGEYAFTQVPAGGSHNSGYDPNDSENNEYKLVVIKEGYQRFEGKVSLVDIDNKIGNVYLFPEGFDTPDYTFTVVYNGRPVDNATVQFQPDADDNEIITKSTDTIDPDSGYLPTLTAQTDADGKVTFAGSQLGLGSRYQVTVLPTEFEGVDLAFEEGAYYVVGKATTDNILYMNDLVASANPYGLYVTYISNADPDQVDPTGTLTIVFSRPVTLTTGAAGFTATEFSPAGILTVGDEVNESLSADGLTLTLTPNWSTPPAAGETGTYIDYNNGTAFISVVGYPDTAFLVFALRDANDVLIGDAVQLSTP